ncbi:Hypothetical predicted protein [Olea europaea subsp. europaea]|uniref:Uncharacterized protein n=1 Tax=Olea europaea subsp. europaea TaxID=158383 RepID=A0A8S0R211_OLEEU|nr:Hypothetical predicted protein [Olea europaea subsp. europaea]
MANSLFGLRIRTLTAGLFFERYNSHSKIDARTNAVITSQQSRRSDLQRQESATILSSPHHHHTVTAHKTSPTLPISMLHYERHRATTLTAAFGGGQHDKIIQKGEGLISSRTIAIRAHC